MKKKILSPQRLHVQFSTFTITWYHIASVQYGSPKVCVLVNGSGRHIKYYSQHQNLSMQGNFGELLYSEQTKQEIGDSDGSIFILKNSQHLDIGNDWFSFTAYICET